MHNGRSGCAIRCITIKKECRSRCHERRTDCRLAAASAAADLQNATDLVREAVGYSGVLGALGCAGITLVLQ
jgi:hypothetical protein